MKNIKFWVKEIILSVYMNLPELIREKWRRNKITILLYHEISPDLFESHLKYIEKRYNVISLERFKQALYQESNEELPSNPIIITFDDGWRSNYELLSVIKKYSVPVTIFIATGLVGTCRKIWNYTLDRQGKDKDLNAYLKNVSNTEKNSFLKEHNGYYPEKNYETRDFLTLDEIKKMLPYVSFQSHGKFHPVYTMCSDEELLHEMTDSKKYIENTSEQSCYAIACPYGCHDQRVVELAQKTGFLLGRVTNQPVLNNLKTDPYRLTAIGIDEKSTVFTLTKQIAAAELKTLFKGW